MTYTADKASDFNTQAQLQIQKILQTYQMLASLISTMQTLIKDLNSAIIQKTG